MSKPLQRLSFISQKFINLFLFFTVCFITNAQTQLNPPLPFLGNVTHFKLSPDGNTVVYRADQNVDGVFELFSVPSNGGTATRLNTDLPTGGDVLEGSFKISPDGDTVIYIAEQNANGRFELFSVPITGGTTVRLNADLNTGGNVLDFNISPNSNHVVYYADQIFDGVNELFSVPITGGTPIRLNTDLPTGADVLFFGEQSQITSNSSHVVYVADQEINNVIELYAVNLTGGTPIKLNGSLISGGDVNGNFIISPDANTVIYMADQIADGFAELFSVPISGGTPTRLNSNLPIADGGGDVRGFKISPDGNTVIYSADQITTDHIELFNVPINGGTPVRINPDLAGSTENISNFQISADNTRVVYLAEANINNIIELFSVPINGGTAIQLNLPLSGVRDIHDFIITPNSQTVIYLGEQEDSNLNELYTIPITGGTPAKLNTPLTNGGDVTHFKLSNNGNVVTYRADQTTNNVFELYSVFATGGAPLRINSNLATGGNVEDDFLMNDTGDMIVYRADQDVDEETEIFSNNIAGSLSVSERANSQTVLSIIPNPAHDSFAISYSGSETITSLTLYDYSGKILFQMDEKSNMKQIPVSHLTSGVYLVGIKTKSGTLTKKLIIE